MTPDRLDAWARIIGRRGALGALLALAGAFLVPERAAGGIEVCAKKSPGQRCRRNGDCCSGRCKTKKNTKGKRKGKCRCSQFLKPCATLTDCCGHDLPGPEAPACGVQSASGKTVCCKSNGGSCDGDGDCCAGLDCGLGGTCQLPI